jgi:hypothetical protein
MAMIDKHYGKYIRNDSQEHLSRLFGAKSATLSETLEAEEEQKQSQVVGNSTEGEWWAHLDSNQHEQKTLRRRISRNSLIFVANSRKHVTNCFPKISRRIPLPARKNRNGFASIRRRPWKNKSVRGAAMIDVRNARTTYGQNCTMGVVTVRLF